MGEDRRLGKLRRGIVWSPFEDTATEEFRRTLDVNLMGSVYGAQAALPVMRRQGSGVIVNIASIAGLVAFPTQTAYAASKAALLTSGRRSGGSCGAAACASARCCPRA